MFLFLLDILKGSPVLPTTKQPVFPVNLNFTHNQLHTDSTPRCVPRNSYTCLLGDMVKNVYSNAVYNNKILQITSVA